MNFSDFQRQIQIVTDPAEIERWKDEARKVTTYSTLREEPPQSFSSVNEAERHFQKNYLPAIVRTVSEIVVDGPASRRMHDRVLNKVIENEWNRETKSPSPMMQELASRFREAGLHVFRHRKGMLFVSPVFPRAFRHDETGVSSQVRTILEAIGAQPRIGRKELADKLITGVSGEGAEKSKLALASDLLWLINAGHVIEFNDGSLDLPRVKKPKQEVVEAVAESKETATAEPEKATEVSAAEEKEERVEAGAPPGDNCSPTVSDGEISDGVSQRRPTREEVANSTESSPTEKEEPTEIGGS